MFFVKSDQFCCGKINILCSSDKTAVLRELATLNLGERVLNMRRGVEIVRF